MLWAGLVSTELFVVRVSEDPSLQTCQLDQMLRVNVSFTYVQTIKACCKVFLARDSKPYHSVVLCTLLMDSQATTLSACPQLPFIDSC